MTKKLVIIDDSSTQLNILKNFFTNNGWEVCAVQSAKIGYEVIFDFAPDLIITDAIMPLMGGFQLVRQIRENQFISKIPVIVYSVLDEANAKFYIKEELSEYFFKKDNNQFELLAMAEKIIEKYPLSKDYKDEILRAGFDNYKVLQDLKIEKDEQNEQIEPQDDEIVSNEEIKEDIEEETEEELIEHNIEDFEEKVKEISNFSLSDEAIFSKLFMNLYDIFDYDMAIVSVYSFDNKEIKSYFDIKNIILSPILKNTILNKYHSKSAVMYKKYSPNLEVATKEEEFLSKIEFDFEYRGEKIADFVCYSRSEHKWDNNEQINLVERILYNFSKARYIQKIIKANKKDNKGRRYIQVKNKFNNLKSTLDAYFTIIQISNYSDISQKLSFQDLDILNLKISESIIECLEKDEQIHKNDEDEYNLIIFAKDKKHAQNRLDYIAKMLSKISHNGAYVNSFIAAASCNIDDNFNIVEAEKNARYLVDDTIHQQSVVIYDV